MTKSRRKSREEALQVLYQINYSEGQSAPDALATWERNFAQESQLEAFSRRVVLGVYEHIADLDKVMEAHATNWRADRMPVVDKNILRLGIYELEYCDDIPATVTINEMVDLAKQYGSENSSAFVNGILDKVKAGLNNPKKAK